MSIQLRYHADANAYVCDSSFEEKHVPKGAGFTWDKIVGKKWATRDAALASKLIRYATPDARERLEQALAARKEAIQMSRAGSMEGLNLQRPEGLDYLPYQQVGIQWGLTRSAALIADEMGLGKTIQLIGIINNDPSIQRVLLICPASLKLNWQCELEKWLTRPLSVGIVWPGQPLPASDILIVNPDILHRYDFYRDTWDLVGVDEAHYFKNAKTRRGKALYGGKERPPINGRRRVLLTGTPIVNKPVELYPLLHWLDPNKWNNFFRYAQRYCGAVQGKYGWEFGGAPNLEALLAELQTELRSTVMIRRRKADVLQELPPKRRAVVVIPSNGSQRLVEAELRAYEQHQARVEEARAARDLAQAGGDKDAYAAAVTRLRQIEGVMMTEMSALRAEMALAKAPHIVAHVANALTDNDGYKVVVFVHHKAVVDLLMEGLTAYHPVKVTGDTSLPKRQAAVDTFQKEDRCQVFVGNLQAAGVGLTLTASAHVVIGELPWTPGEVSQAEDRTHRIGQQDSVLVEHLVFDNSLDAKMAKTIIHKQTIIDAALDDAVDPDLLTDVALADEEPGAQQKAKAKAQAVTDLTLAQIHAVQEALRILAGHDVDHAAQRNEIGFNRYDSKVGHDLAQVERLNPKQAALGYRVVRKYHRQLPTRIVEILGGGTL